MSKSVPRSKSTISCPTVTLTTGSTTSVTRIPDAQCGVGIGQTIYPDPQQFVHMGTASGHPTVFNHCRRKERQAEP